MLTHVSSIYISLLLIVNLKIFQVIFHAVEQLKNLQLEDAEVQSISSTIAPTTLPHAPGQQQPLILSQQSSVAANEQKPVNIIQSTPPSDQEKPELGEETPEANYATPETNHEIPEIIHESTEINQETIQLVYDNKNSTDKFKNSTIIDNFSSKQSSQSSFSSEEFSEEVKKDENKKKINEKTKINGPSVDTVVEEIYGIMKPQNKSEDSSEESQTNESGESKDFKDDSEEDEQVDENR